MPATAAHRSLRRCLALAGSLVVSALATLAGCGKQQILTQPLVFSSSDSLNVANAIAVSGLGANSLLPSGECALGGTGGSDPVAVRRRVAQIDDDRVYAYSDTVAGHAQSVTVTIAKYQKGTLEIVQQYAPQDATPADSSDRLVDKILRQRWLRNVLLHRDGASFSGWRVIDASEASLRVDDQLSCTDCHAEITRLELATPGELLILPIVPAVQVDSLRHVHGVGPWTLNAQTRNDDNVVIVHDAQGAHRLAKDGVRTFTGQVALGPPGLRHFTVEAFADSTLSDSSYPVSQHGYSFTVAVDP